MMRSTTWARLLLLLLIGGGFGIVVWQLITTAPESQRTRPAAPTPLVDVIDSQPRRHALVLEAAGPVVSAYELQVRPQVTGRIVTLHPDFEPGGRIPAGEPLLQIEDTDYRLAAEAAEAEIAKAQAAITIEQGRRVVAREELASLQGSLQIDASSQALALRKPQLRQVQAELAAAQNRLKIARLDLERTTLRLPFDVLVLERTRVADEVVAARELVGRVTRADEVWVDLRTAPDHLDRLNARDGETAGSRVLVHGDTGTFEGDIVRIRADLATDSRLAGVIASVPVSAADNRRLLIGSYVRASIEAGEMADAIVVPRRAVHDNRRVWVVDAHETLKVREAQVHWASGQELLLAAATLQDGDRVVISRVTGLVPGTLVRSRRVDPATGRTLAESSDVAAHD